MFILVPCLPGTEHPWGDVTGGVYGGLQPWTLLGQGGVNLGCSFPGCQMQNTYSKRTDKTLMFVHIHVFRGKKSILRHWFDENAFHRCSDKS